MWFWLVLIGGAFGSIRSLVSRMIMRDERESLNYTFIYQVLNALFVVPVFVFSLTLPKSPFPYFVLFLMGAIDSLAVYWFLESARFLEASLRGIIISSETLWVLIFGALLLEESLALRKIAGVLLIFLGIVLAIFKKERVGRLKSLWRRVFKRDKTAKEKGVILVLTATFLKALEKMVIKHLLEEASPLLVAFGIRTFSGLCLLPLIKNSRSQVTNLIKRKSGLVFLHSFVGAISFLFFLWASSIAEISKTVAIGQSFTVVTVLAGIIFLKEKERIWQKVLGAVLAAIGVILVKGGGE